MIALVKRAGFFLLILLATGSCYFPSDFKADIRIDTKGNYVFVYKGNLTDLSMAQRMARGDLAGDALVKRIGVAERDLRRLKGFEKLDYTEKARFKVDYVRRGNILFEKSFNFVRLSSRFLTIKYDKRKHEISVEGGKPNEHHANALEKAGLKFNGELRIWTNARVSEHNSKKIQAVSGLKLYRWDIVNVRQKVPLLRFTPQ